MQIFSASVEQIKEQFLHAGYISSCPCSQSDSAFGSSESAFSVIDLKNALELKTTTVLSSDSSIISGMISFFKSSDFLIILFASLSIFFLFYLVSILLKKFPKLNHGMTALLTVCLMFSFFIYSSCGGSDIDETLHKETNLKQNESIGFNGKFNFKPIIPEFPNSIDFSKTTFRVTEYAPVCENEPDREYKNPEKATEAILYGFLADALTDEYGYSTYEDQINFNQNIKIPVKDPTEGITYAANHACYDGWGNEFKFTEIYETGYRKYKHWIDVRSSGADSVFFTDDDINLKIIPSHFMDEYIEQGVLTTFFVTKHEDKNIGLFRKDKYECDYQPKNLNLAETLTDDTNFDAMVLPDNIEEEFEIENKITENSLLVISFRSR